MRSPERPKKTFPTKGCNAAWWPLVRSQNKFSSVESLSRFRLFRKELDRPPCPSPTPRVYSNSFPSSRWCHPAISSSVTPFSSCPQSLQASGSSMSQLFAWGGQSIGVSASASVLPMKYFAYRTKDWANTKGELGGCVYTPPHPSPWGQRGRHTMARARRQRAAAVLAPEMASSSKLWADSQLLTISSWDLGPLTSAWSVAAWDQLCREDTRHTWGPGKLRGRAGG